MTDDCNTLGNRLSDQITRMENYILELVEDEGLYNLREDGYDPKEHVKLMHEFEKINEKLRSTRFLSRYNPFNKYVRELAKKEKKLQKKLEPYNKFVLTDYIKVQCERLRDSYEEVKDKKSYIDEGKKPGDKHSTLKKIGAVVGMGLIGAGIIFGASFIGKKDQNNLKDHVYENMEKINSTLHEKGFSYRFDNITDNVNLHEIVPYNFKITGQGSFGIDIAIDDNKIPENIKTFKALVELGSILKNNKEIAPQMNCYKFLVGEKENYTINIILPVLDHPNDIIPPSELIKTKIGDCEDYSLLYASYYNTQNIPAFVIIDNGHAVAAVGDIPFNPDELKEYIKENRTFIVGSSEYLNKDKSFDFSITVKPTCTRDILNNLKIKYSSADIRAIISKDNILIKEGPYYFNLSEFGYLDKEYAKEAADYLNMNISKDEIDKMADEYYKFYGTLAKKAIESQRENNMEFYQKIKNVLNDSYEEKAVKNFFNETFINNF